MTKPEATEIEKLRMALEPFVAYAKARHAIFGTLSLHSYLEPAVIVTNAKNGQHTFVLTKKHWMRRLLQLKETKNESKTTSS